MDYEKKYNEALAWMRGVYPTLTGAAKEDAEHYFPELCESEDELIRKELLAVLNRIPSDCQMAIFLTNSKKQRYISYLEKQKEQKPTDLPAGFYYIDLNGNRYYSKEFRYGDMKLKVGEQKPVEYKPKAGEDIYHAINEAIGLAIDIQRSVSLCFNGITLNVFPESCISEIVSYYHEQIKDDVQREKPAWSEEDKRILKGIIEKIDHDQTYGVSKDEMLNFLKQLKKL